MARSPKVRCPQCGAKNDEVEMCRICGLSLPGAAAIRQRAAADGSPAFKETVETERAAWRDYSEGRESRSVRSRRPPDLPILPPSAWGDPAAAVTGFTDGATAKKRRPWQRA